MGKRAGLPKAGDDGGMKRAARGLDVPAGTAQQEAAAMKCLQEFMTLTGLTMVSLDEMNVEVSRSAVAPSKNFYSFLTAFGIFLQTKKSTKSRASDQSLSKATALGYFSQALNMLRERYPQALTDGKRVGSIRDKMAGAIDEKNVRSNIQVNDAPGCTLKDLLVVIESIVIRSQPSGYKSVHDAAVLTMMWHTFGRAIDTCFARKNQLVCAASGELFLRVARVKTSTVQGLSIYKSAAHWQQCVFHALGMLFVCTTEPSEYVFPLLPRVAESDLPGGRMYTQEEAMMFWENLELEHDERPAKKIRARPNVAKYINDVLALATNVQTSKTQLTPNLTSHSIRRGSAAYANACPKLSVQWISTRGAWLLDSLTKAFAYIGTTTREDQSVGKILAGYTDPDLPVTIPSITSLEHRLPPSEYSMLQSMKRELFRTVSGFPDPKLNVAADVLDAALAAMLIHLPDIERVVGDDQCFFLYQWQRAALAVNEKLGCRLDFCLLESWGCQLRSSWQVSNHRQFASPGIAADAIGAGLSQLLTAVHHLQEQVSVLTHAHNELLKRLDPADARTQTAVEPVKTFAPVAATANTLSGTFFNWYVHRWWQPAAAGDKATQNARSDAKICVHVLLLLQSTNVHIPAQPLDEEGHAYHEWRQSLWTMAEAFARDANRRLHALDGKNATRTAGSLRKRWRALKKQFKDEHELLCSDFKRRQLAGLVVDDCTPSSSQWCTSDAM